VDFTYFVTAHELGHSGGPTNSFGGRLEGSNMLSGILAEYSALMVMKEGYGTENMHRFL
jgi:hypothetical protein